MQPERSRERLRSNAVARGRMFLKSQLAWLPGYPIHQRPGRSAQAPGGVDWQPLGILGTQLQASIRLGATHLQQASYTWSKLVHRFPRALSRIVADEERWRQAVPQLLDLLKGAIHQAKTLPRSLFDVPGAHARNAVERARDLVRREASLAPALDALSWRCLLDPDALEENLAWIESRRVELARLLAHADTVKSVLQLADIARSDGARRVDPLLEVLADPRSHHLPTQLPSHYLLQWSKRFTRRAKGKADADSHTAIEADVAKQSIAFLHWAVQQRDPVRRRALDMFALLSPQPSLDNWAAWWGGANSLLERGERLIQALPSEPVRDSLLALSEGVATCGRNQPPGAATAVVLDNIRSAAAPGRQALYAPLLELLRQLPHAQGTPSARAAFLAHWLLRFESHKERAVALLRDVREFLKGPADEVDRFALWQSVVAHWDAHHAASYWTFDEQILDELRRPAAWSSLFDALRHCAEQRIALAESDTERLIELCKVTNDGARAATYLRELINCKINHGYFNEPLFRCAHRLDAHGGQFLQLVTALSKVIQEDTEVGDALVSIADPLAQAGWPTLVRDLVLSGEVRSLVLLHQKRAALRALGGLAASTPEWRCEHLPEWAQHYPAQLRSTLAMLACLTADARDLAGRILNRHFPDPAALAQEIATIEHRLAQFPDEPRLVKRLANRQRQLHEPATVSAAHLSKLENKLLHLVHLHTLRGWDEQIARDLEACLRETLGLEQLPDWLLQSRQLRLIGAIVGLPQPTRKLAWQLLRVRCGAPPWRLVDEPANRAFVARLKALGIDPDPWINPPATKRYEAPDGRVLWLSFEEDPLEIFQMGSHFETCLSPGDVNFFSVFANAADINKHVIYARDSAGRIVGRCLIALTGRGALLTFAPYCHDPQLGFADMIAALVAQLASDMKTVIVPRGSVPCLVASDWYDDGPRDLCNRFEFLKRGSALQLSLATMKLEQIVPALEAAFVPIPLNALSLPLILEMEVMEERPQLVAPLLPYIEACKGLLERSWLRAASLALRSNEYAFAYRVLRKQAVGYLLRQQRRFGYYDRDVLQALVEYDPSAALQVLRRTRSRGVRTDTQETDRFRLAMLARAHAQLNRQSLADALRGSES